jgi:hypothetical protein
MPEDGAAGEPPAGPPDANPDAGRPYFLYLIVGLMIAAVVLIINLVWATRIPAMSSSSRSSSSSSSSRCTPVCRPVCCATGATGARGDTGPAMSALNLADSSGSTDYSPAVGRRRSARSLIPAERLRPRFSPAPSLSPGTFRRPDPADIVLPSFAEETKAVATSLTAARSPLPDPTGSSAEGARFERRPAPFVNGIGCSGGECTISGLHFAPGVRVSLDNDRHNLLAIGAAALSPNLIRLTADLAAFGTGPVHLLVMNPDSQSFFLRDAIQPPPSESDDGHYISFAPLPARFERDAPLAASVILYDRGLPVVGNGASAGAGEIALEVLDTFRSVLSKSERPVRSGVADFASLDRPAPGVYLLRASYRDPENAISPPQITSFPLHIL